MCSGVWPGLLQRLPFLPSRCWALVAHRHCLAELADPVSVIAGVDLLIISARLLFKNWGASLHRIARNGLTGNKPALE